MFWASLLRLASFLHKCCRRFQLGGRVWYQCWWQEVAPSRSSSGPSTVAQPCPASAVCLVACTSPDLPSQNQGFSAPTSTGETTKKLDPTASWTVWMKRACGLGSRAIQLGAVLSFKLPSSVICSSHQTTTAESVPLSVDSTCIGSINRERLLQGGRILCLPIVQVNCQLPSCIRRTHQIHGRILTPLVGVLNRHTCTVLAW